VANPQDIERAIPGLGQFLRDASKIGKEFNKELRKGSVEVAQHVVNRTQANASTEAERLVAKSIQARVAGFRIGVASEPQPNCPREGSCD